MGRTLDRDADVDLTARNPGARQYTADWKGFPVTVVALSRSASNGSQSATRWVQIPLERQAVSIAVVTSVENDAVADQVLQDFLVGLDGPSNWIIVKPLSPTEQAIHVALGIGLIIVLAATPIFVVQFLRRRQVLAMKSITEPKPLHEAAR